jgi:hypothetical protein
MSEDTVTTHYKTSRPITDSEMLNALKGSMNPIFTHFEEELAKNGGEGTLMIEVTATEGSLKLSYGFPSADADVRLWEEG